MPLLQRDQWPIYTLTLNPALDVSADCPVPVTPGPKLRLDPPRSDPGGGGVNVARAILRLGGAATAVVALGGPTGAEHERMLRAEGLVPKVLPAPGDTRQSLTVTEAESGDQYRFVLPGAPWDMAREAAVLDELADLMPMGSILVLSGSQPPGLSVDFPARLAARLAPRDIVLIADTSGAALRHLVEAPVPGAAPRVLRMDEAEAEALAGASLSAPRDTLGFAQSLVEKGVAQVVVMARGANGSVLAGPGERLHAIPPHVTVGSKVGAGDSFTGAFALALARGATRSEALLFGTAAAAAAVMTPATELCRAEDVEALLPRCRLG
ncbi:1-phosphofructokinase family hexose kinase [Plastorhodobacter daqingensis]|uniref:Phosphofructokinase n=1 Tax=Plastorhodobacter daqingensis TaxID=1387281 RepID=A0ABW2UJ21_9RHOB